MLNYEGDTLISFKILKEPMLVEKQLVTHMKATILSFLQPEEQGRDNTVGAPCLIPTKRSRKVKIKVAPRAK